MKWSDAPIWLRVLCVVALLNFVSFLTVSALLGGDGLNGKIDGDRYFVANHGHYTEVSKAAFDYSRLHALSVILTHFMVMAGGTWFIFRSRR